MIRNQKQHSISGVFVFLLLGVFAVFGTLLVLLGAQNYRSMVDRTARHNETRLIESFVRHAVRSGDSAGDISVQVFDGLPVLVIQDAELAAYGESYASFIYAYDGTLYELYTGDGFQCGVGEEICAASSFDAEIQDQRLNVTIADADGNAHKMMIALYCNQ